MNLLQLIQEVSLRLGLPKPSIIASSRDDQTLQLMALMNEVLDDLNERKAWTSLQREAIFTSVAAEDQGALTTLADPGFREFSDPRLFDRSGGESIIGPISSEVWQADKAGIASVSSISYRIRQGHLYLLPAPAAGKTIAFEYLSSYPVLNAAGTAKQYFSSDDDTCYYPNHILILGLRAVWKREKGMRYAEEFRKFEAAVANFAGKDGAPAPVNLSAEVSVRPGVNVPDRNWSV